MNKIFILFFKLFICLKKYTNLEINFKSFWVDEVLEYMPVGETQISLSEKEKKNHNPVCTSII